MCNCEKGLMVTFVFLIIAYIIKTIYELSKANNELAHKYLKYGIIVLSTLTIASYVTTTDLNKAINENQIEIYQLELRKDKIDNNIVKDRLSLLKENNNIITKMPQQFSLSYYFLNILGFLILFIMMFFEKRALLKNKCHNK